MTVRAMTAADIGAVAALERACFSEPWSEAALREELTNPCAAFQVAVGDDGAVLGYCGMHLVGDEGFIANVAVSPDARRQGIARALLARRIEDGRSRGLYRLTLEVRAGNRPAIALYEGAGFIRDGVRPGFYRDPAEDAAVYSYYFAV